MSLRAKRHLGDPGSWGSAWCLTGHPSLDGQGDRNLRGPWAGRLEQVIRLTFAVGHCKPTAVTKTKATFLLENTQVASGNDVKLGRLVLNQPLKWSSLQAVHLGPSHQSRSHPSSSTSHGSHLLLLSLFPGPLSLPGSLPWGQPATVPGNT